MLEVNNLSAHYGQIQVLWDVCLKINEAEILALVGANGAGKTTLLHMISGIMRPILRHRKLSRPENRWPTASRYRGARHFSYPGRQKTLRGYVYPGKSGDGRLFPPRLEK